MPLFINFPEWLKPEIIPGLPIRWYGLMYIIAFGVAYLLFKRLVTHKSRALGVAYMAKEDVVNLFFWVILGLVLGARVFYMLVYGFNEFIENPIRMFWPFDGCKLVGFSGMSYHGGVIGFVIALILYCRVNKKDFFEIGDMFAACIPLGYTFGRLGNFINGELYGGVTMLPWGMVFRDAKPFAVSKPWVQDVMTRVGMVAEQGKDVINLPRHPSQLYEMLFEGIVLWLILWFICKNFKTIKGFMIGAYLVGYGAFRFILEYFRYPDLTMPNDGFPIMFDTSVDLGNHLVRSPVNFTTGQILCFFMIVAGIGLILVMNKRATAAAVKTEFAASEAPKPDHSLRKMKKKIK